MEQTIKLPKRLSSLRIKHFEALKDERFAEITNGKETNLEDRVAFLALFTGYELSIIQQATKKQVETMFNHVLSIFDDFKPSLAPPMQLTVNGKVYQRINPETVASSWHIDFEKSDINKDPVQLACLFYFPKGEKYAAVDDNNNIINPIYTKGQYKGRYDDFKEHFPLTVFLESTSFFLQSWLRSTNKSMEKERAEKKAIAWLQNTIGRSPFRRFLRSIR
jgi:hypothetical protein